MTDEHIGRLKTDISSKNKIRRDMERRISISFGWKVQFTIYVDN